MQGNSKLNPNFKTMVRIKPCEVENSTVAAISNSVLSIKELPQPGREHIKTNDINYKFDSVFDYKLNQEEFFDQIKDYYVPHLLSGQSASIFSYGPSQGGKSFTIFGEDEIFTPGDEFQEGQTNRMGMVARTVEYILKLKQEDKEMNIELNCHLVDVYMDKLRDLGKTLVEGGTRNSKMEHQQQQFYENEDMDITENLSGQTQVKQLKKITVLSMKDIYNLLKCAFKIRSKTQNKFNNLQSKTHTIFTLNLEIYDKTFGQKTVQLHFIDLAGTEKIQKINMDNQKFQESVTISANHLILQQCLQKFSFQNQISGMPSKECKLTRYVQGTFQGGSLIILLVNIDPSDLYLHENLISVHFSESTKQKDFQSKLLEEQLNIGLSQGMEKAVRQLNFEISEIQKKIDLNQKDYMHKLQELQKQLDLSIDLNELATHPSEKDVQYINQMREAEEKLANQVQLQQELKFQNRNQQILEYQSDQRKVQDNLKKQIQQIIQKNSLLKSQISQEKVKFEKDISTQVKSNMDNMNTLTQRSTDMISKRASVLVNMQDNLQIKLDKQAQMLRDYQQNVLVKNQYVKQNIAKLEEEYKSNLDQLTKKFEKYKQQREEAFNVFQKDFQHCKDIKKEEIQQGEAELMALQEVSNQQRRVIEKAIRGDYTNGFISISIPQKELPNKYVSPILQHIFKRNKMLMSDKYFDKPIAKNYVSQTLQKSGKLQLQGGEKQKDIWNSKAKAININNLVNANKLNQAELEHFCDNMKRELTYSEERISVLQKMISNQHMINSGIDIQKEIEDKNTFQKSFLKQWKANNKSKQVVNYQKDIINVKNTQSQDGKQLKFYQKYKYGLM